MGPSFATRSVSKHPAAAAALRLASLGCWGVARVAGAREAILPACLSVWPLASNPAFHMMDPSALTTSAHTQHFARTQLGSREG